MSGLAGSSNQSSQPQLARMPPLPSRCESIVPAAAGWYPLAVQFRPRDRTKTIGKGLLCDFAQGTWPLWGHLSDQDTVPKGRHTAGGRESHVAG